MPLFYILLIFWTLWLFTRGLLQYWLKDAFGFDYFHHYDIGFVWASLGIVAIYFNMPIMSWFFIVGLIMIVDDIIGHYKRSLGKKEESGPMFRLKGG